MRTSQLHYQSCFSIRLLGQEAHTWAQLIRTIRNWMIEKGPLGASIDQPWFYGYGRWESPENQFIFVETARTDGAAQNGIPEFWAVRMQIQDRNYSARFWRTDVGVTCRNHEDPVISVTVSNYIRPGYIGEEPPVASPSAPKLISKLMNSSWLPHAGTLPLKLAAELYGEPDVENVLSILASPGRTCPIILVTRESTHGHPTIDPYGITTKTAGAAAVFVSKDGYAEKALIDAMPIPFRTVNGAIRVFMPGLDFNKVGDDRRHRFYSRAQIEELGPAQVANEIIRGTTRRMDLSRREAVFTLEDVREKYRQSRLRQLRQSGEPSEASEWLTLLEAENKDLSERLRDVEEQLRDSLDLIDRAESVSEIYRNDAEDSKERLAELDQALGSVSNLRHLPNSVEECLALICRLFPTNIVATDRAMRSAKEAQINTQKQEMNLVWELLYSLANDFHRIVFNERPDRTALPQRFKELSGFDLALAEGKQTRSDSKLMNLRRLEYGGQVFDMEPHIKLGNKEPKILRVYFAIDGDNCRVIVGHCGDHLQNYSSRKRN